MLGTQSSFFLAVILCFFPFVVLVTTWNVQAKLTGLGTR